MLNFDGVIIKTPREPTAEEYAAAGGFEGELERNKARHNEIYGPNEPAADVSFPTWYVKIFDFIEKFLPEIK